MKKRQEMIECNKPRSKVTSYEQGDYIKVEIFNERTKEIEWAWIQVDHCDDANRIVFGRLDNAPVVNTNLKLGQELAVSYDNIKAHRRSSDFE